MLVDDSPQTKKLQVHSATIEQQLAGDVDHCRAGRLSRRAAPRGQAGRDRQRCRLPLPAPGSLAESLPMLCVVALEHRPAAACRHWQCPVASSSRVSLLLCQAPALLLVAALSPVLDVQQGRYSGTSDGTGRRDRAESKQVGNQCSCACPSPLTVHGEARDLLVQAQLDAAVVNTLCRRRQQVVTTATLELAWRSREQQATLLHTAHRRTAEPAAGSRGTHGELELCSPPAPALPRLQSSRRAGAACQAST